MKPISKSRESGVIFIVRLIRKVTHWIFNFAKARLSSSLYVYEKVSESFWRTNGSHNRQGSCFTLCVQKLKHNGFYVHTKHCTVKHFNNLIEQDHRHIKRRFVKSAGFQNLRHASRTLKGIETLHAIYKQKRSHIPDFSFQRTRNYSSYSELLKLQLYFVSRLMFFKLCNRTKNSLFSSEYIVRKSADEVASNETMNEEPISITIILLFGGGILLICIGIYTVLRKSWR